PGSGLFVERRLQHLAALTDLVVMAPIAAVQYGNPHGKRLLLQKPAARAGSGKLETLHPRWFYPPFSGSFTALWLFACLTLPLYLLQKRFRFEIIDTHFGHPEGIAGSFLAGLLRLPFTMTLRGNEPKHSATAISRFLM